jgi:hypothetical protein
MLHMIAEGHRWKTSTSHYQVLQNVYVMLHMIAEDHILTIV